MTSWPASFFMVKNLPPLIPLFPLPNAVLFPRMLLPLHVFEARYRRMVRDALGERRLIGMVLLRAGWEDDYEGRPAVFQVGTVGRISEYQEFPDGRYGILLLGLREFQVLEEQGDQVYRCARVRWRHTGEHPGLSAAARDELVALARRRLGSRLYTDWVRLVSKAGGDDEVLVNSLAQGGDFSSVETLWLLEAPSITERAQRLRDLLEFQLQESRSPGGQGGARHWEH